MDPEDVVMTSKQSWLYGFRHRLVAFVESCAWSLARTKQMRNTLEGYLFELRVNAITHALHMAPMSSLQPLFKPAEERSSQDECRCVASHKRRARRNCQRQTGGTLKAALA